MTTEISILNFNVNNINIAGNTISSIDTDGNINLTPNGLGSVNINKFLCVDTINEFTTDNGVNIDNVLLKDGLINNIDLSVLKLDIDGFPDELKNLTSGEINQLKNIDSNTISNIQWNYISNMDQNLSVNDHVFFNELDVNDVNIVNNNIRTGNNDFVIGAPINQQLSLQVDNTEIVNITSEGLNIVIGTLNIEKGVCNTGVLSVDDIDSFFNVIGPTTMYPDNSFIYKLNNSLTPTAGYQKRDTLIQTALSQNSDSQNSDLHFIVTDDSTDSPYKIMSLKGYTSGNKVELFSPLHVDVINEKTTNYGVTINNSLVVGNPIGGNKGNGTINANAIYDDGVVLTDFVFKDDYNILSIDEMEKFYTKNNHLPTIDGEKKWNENKFSLGKLVNQLWETVECQAIYISQLNNEINKLKNIQ